MSEWPLVIAYLIGVVNGAALAYLIIGVRLAKLLKKQTAPKDDQLVKHHTTAAHLRRVQEIMSEQDLIYDTIEAGNLTQDSIAVAGQRINSLHVEKVRLLESILKSGVDSDVLFSVNGATKRVKLSDYLGMISGNALQTKPALKLVKQEDANKPPTTH